MKRSSWLILISTVISLLAVISARAQTTSGYVSITPCRMVDTRVDTSGGPITSTVRNLTLTGAAYSGVPASKACVAATAVPTNATSVQVNFTMTDVAGSTDLRVAPYGAAPVSSVMNSAAGATIANAIAEAVASDGAGGMGISVKSGGAQFNLLVDVVGYYTNVGNTAAAVVAGFNNSGSGPGAYGYSGNGNGVEGYSGSADGVHGTGGSNGVSGLSSNAAASGVFGQNNGGGYGVVGNSDTGTGVYGSTSGSSGAGGGAAAVLGDTNNYYGVWGRSAVNDGVRGQSTTGTGVTGISGTGWGLYAHSGTASAIQCDTASPSANAITALSNAGSAVFGQSQTGDGIAGQSLGGYDGVVGDSSAACGGNGVHGIGSGCAWAIYADGSENITQDFYVIGSKNFVEPHPMDPAKEIHFASLEGPESGTYFRGKAELVRGTATIPVPESFRLVTDSDGITVSLTPVGELATLAVMKVTLNEIEVQGSRDVEFHYMVNGVRKSQKDYQSIVANRIFVPRSASDPNFGKHFNPSVVLILKGNGILNEDGSINLETARRLGWDQRPGWNATATEVVR
jgi:hypothetical protein